MNDCSVDWVDWQGEMPATLMFIVRDGEVLLPQNKARANSPLASEHLKSLRASITPGRANSERGRSDSPKTHQAL